MPTDPVFNPEGLTSKERWRRSEQRGRDNDARFMRQARTVFGTGVVLVTFVLMVFLAS